MLSNTLGSTGLQGKQTCRLHNLPSFEYSVIIIKIQ